MAAQDDPEYPDLDGEARNDEVLAFPEARILGVVRSELRGCRLELPDGAVIEAVDATFDDVDLTGRRIDGLKRVRFTRCRLGGADLGGTTLEDVHFDDCVLELASFRSAELRDVRIAGGRCDELDLSGATLRGVTIADVDLSSVALDGARMEDVDLTGAGLDGLSDLRALRGATISGVQAVALAPRLAHAAGLAVADDG